MCTIGAVATSDSHGRPVVFALKTSDYRLSGIWHGIIQGGKGHDILGSQRWEVSGVNAGMNRKGLTVLRAYLGYQEGPFENIGKQEYPKDSFSFDLDRRGAITAAMLECCCWVDEALSYFHDALPRYCNKGSGQKGILLMLTDIKGHIGVIEFCEDRIASKIYPEGYTARGNNGLLVFLEEQASLSDVVRKDREHRYYRMLKEVREVYEMMPKGISKTEALAKLKGVLSWHGPAGETEPGAICAHGIKAPGARFPGNESFWTIAGVIFDVVEGRMHYAAGSTPCNATWRSLTFPD